MPRHDSTLLRYEAWTLPWSGDFKRLIASIPVVEGSGKGAILFREVAGDGSMDIDLSTFDRIDDIISDTTGSLIRVYDGTTIIHEWLAERIEHSHSDEQRIASISGPSLQSAFDKWIVYPYDYPATPSVTPDWIYGGRNTLSNPGFEDNNSTKTIYRLFLDATGGTFTLNSGGSTTAPIDWDVSDRPLEVAMEAIASIDDVNVSPLGGEVALAYKLEISAETGTFTLSDGTDTTSAIDHAPSAATIETRIVADLGSINNVDVTFVSDPDGDFFIIDFIDPVSADLSIDTTNLDDGSASLSVSRTGEGFEIEFVDPEIENNMILNTTGLTGDASLVLTQEGELLPSGWTKSTQVSEGTPREYGVYDAFQPSTSQAHSGTQSLFIDPGDVNSDIDRYAGAQQIIGVTPGQTYQAKIWIYPTAAGQSYRLVIRGIDGDLLTDKLYNFSPPANTWTQLVVPDVVPDESEVIFRIANIDPPVTDPAGFYIDDAELNEGQAASNVGLIVNELMDDATTDHSADARGEVLTWVDYTSVTLTQDSSGVDWDQEISINIPFGATYGQAWDAITELGYEWKLVPKTSPTATLTHDLHWYNKGNGDTAPSAAVTVRQGVIGGSVLKRLPSFTAAITEGADGAYLEDANAAEGTFGRIEAFAPHRETSETSTLQATLDELFSEEADNRTGAQFSLIATHDHVRPLIDFSPGDTIPMQMPPALPKEDRRIQRVDYVNSYPTKYVVVGSRIFLGEEAGGWELVRRMWRKFRRRDEDTKPGALSIGGGGGAIDVAAVDAPEWQKAIARYQCDGVDDHLEIQAAIEEAFSFDAGVERNEVKLSSGEFLIGSGWIKVIAAVHLRGQGLFSTFLRNQDEGSDDPDNALIVVQQDAELSGLGFRTTIDHAPTGQVSFKGICVTCEYGIVHNLHHYDGNARNFIFFDGTIHMAHSLDSWGDYGQDNPEGGLGQPYPSMLAFGEGWFEVHGVNASIGGTAIWVDSFGNATLTNVRAENALFNVEPEHPSPLILIDNAGGLTISNVALRAPFSSVIEVESYPYEVLISNAWLSGAYGIRAQEGWGVDRMSLSNVNITATTSGLDINDVRELRIVGLTIDKSSGSVGSGYPIEAGYGARFEVSVADASLEISDFRIEGYEEDGLVVSHQSGYFGQKISIHDGLITDMQKHGLVVDSARANIHDVIVENVGQGATNTDDAFHLKGEMDQPRLHNNAIIGASQLRYGINIADPGITRAIVVGNSGGDPSDFGTDALNDQGTDTQLEYPSDATYGDNFFRSGSSSGAGQIVSVEWPASGPRDIESAQPIGVAQTSPSTLTVTSAVETEIAETVAPPIAPTFEDDWTGTDGDSWDAGKWDTSVVGSATVDIQSNEGRFLMNGNQTKGRAIANHSAISDSRVLVKVRGTVLHNNLHGFIILRGDGQWDTSSFEEWRPHNGYMLSMQIQNTGTLNFQKHVDGSTTNVGSATSFPWSTDAHWVKVEAVDSGGDVILRAKIWLTTDPEPGTWTLSVTDTGTPHASGVLQLSGLRSTSGSESVFWDDLTLTEI